MLILIAESKTMAQAIPVSTSAETRPPFERIADEVAHRLRSLSMPELAALLKLGPKSAEAAFRYFYDFPDKTTGRRAIEAFTGVVFRHLDYPSLHPAARDFINANVGIISSIYGFLHPGDIVKPYRMDFNSVAMPGGKTPMQYWRDILPEALAADMRRQKHDCLLNLLPKDAEACIGLKKMAAGRGMALINADFRIQSGAKLITPPAGRLKAMRGRLLRDIAANSLTSADALRGIETDLFAFDSELSEGGNFVFVGV